MGKPGHLYTIARGKSGMIGAYKIETQVISGTGKFERTGLALIGRQRKYRNSLQVLQGKQQKYSGSISVTTRII